MRYSKMYLLFLVCLRFKFYINKIHVLVDNFMKL